MAKVDAYRNGISVPVTLFPEHIPFHRPGLYLPIDTHHVVGIDTESFTFKQDKKLRTVRASLDFIDESPIILDTTDSLFPLELVIDELFPRFKVKEDRPSRTKQRNKRQRPDGYRRDGRKQYIQPVVLIFHELGKDFGRLMRKNEYLSRVIQTVMSSVRVKIGKYELEIDKLIVSGNAPNFEFYVRKDKQIMRLIGRDTGGYWKNTLEEIASNLLGSSLTPRNDELSSTFYEDIGSEERDFARRLMTDRAKVKREIYMATIELLREISPYTVTRHGLIPSSAPGAAARTYLSMVSPDVKKWYRTENHIMQYGASSVHAGRLIDLTHGYQEHIWIRDFESAYPYAMTQVPDPSTCEYRDIEEPMDYEEERWRGRYGNILVSGRGLNERYPALFTHNKITGKLQPVNGVFKEVWASIPEVVCGVESGRIEIETIHKGVELVGTSEYSALRAFVLKMHEIKQSCERGNPLYLLAKLLMNSLNGKFLEIIHQPIVIDSKLAEFPIPQLSNIEEYPPKILKAFTYGGKTAADKVIDEICEKATGYEPYIQVSTIIDNYAYTTQPAKAGYYYLPVHGSNVIGLISASLGVAAFYTHAPFGHTDSLFTNGEQREGMERYYEIMKRAGYPVPKEGLGSFKLEMKDAYGYISKPGLYALRNEQGEIKYAHHSLQEIAVDIPPDASPKEKEQRMGEIVYADLKEAYESHSGRITYHSKKHSLTIKESIQLGLEPGTPVKREDIQVFIKTSDDIPSFNEIQEEAEEAYDERNKHFNPKKDPETLIGEFKLARTPFEKVQWMFDSGWTRNKIAVEVGCSERTISSIRSGDNSGQRQHKKITSAFERRLSQLNYDNEYNGSLKKFKLTQPQEQQIAHEIEEEEYDYDRFIDETEDSYGIPLDDPTIQMMLKGEIPLYFETLLEKHRDNPEEAEPEYSLFAGVDPKSFNDCINKEVNVLGCTVLPHPAYRSKKDGSIQPGYEKVYLLLDEKDSNGSHVVISTSGKYIFSYMTETMKYRGWYLWEKPARYRINKGSKSGAFFMQNVRSKLRRIS